MKMSEEPMRFNHVTRLGNWYERQVLEESNMKDYLLSKEKKTLLSDRTYHSTSVPLANSSAALLFGQNILLQSCHNTGLLAVDSSRPVRQYEVSTCGTQQTERTVFRLCVPGDSNAQEGQEVLYGQRVVIRGHKTLSDHALTLNSSQPSPTRQSKVTKKQEVTVGVAQCLAESIWCFEHIDPAQRFKRTNTPVDGSGPVLLKHVYTQQWLASGDPQLTTGFGVEHEVYAHSHSCLSKTQNLFQEKQGSLTINENLRSQGSQNSWTLINQDICQTVVQTPMGAEGMLGMLRHSLGNSKSLLAYRKLHLRMDTLVGDIQVAHLQSLLASYQVAIQQDPLSHIVATLQSQGVTTYGQLKDIVIAPLSPARLALVKSVYAHIQTLCGGQVSLGDIARLYNPAKDPQLLNHSMTEGQVFSEFMKHWRTQERQCPVGEEDFLDYYQDISNAMPRDDHFEYLLRTAWNSQ